MQSRQNNALKTHEGDNVAIAVQRIEVGTPVVVGGEVLFEAVDDIEPGHKLALEPIESGGAIFRYGEPILKAVRAIRPGEWVHVHNGRPMPGDLKE